MGKFKNIEAIIEITDMKFPNIGIGYYEDKRIEIKNTLIGQKVKTFISKSRKKYVGNRSEVFEKADYEIAPKCQDFRICGGCTFQSIPYEKELEIKEKLVLDIFKSHGVEINNYLGINKSPLVEEYRNKMEYSFGDEEKDGDLALGMRKINSFYEVVTSKHCNIVDEDFRNILTLTLNFFKNTDEQFYHKMRRTGTLRHLLVRKGHNTGDIIIGLVTTSDLKADVNSYKETLLNSTYKGTIKGIYQIVNDNLADTVIADQFITLYGDEFFYDEILGLKFKISPFSFFQTNTKGAEELYSIVLDFLGDVDNKKVFDLYSGTGTIGQIVSKKASEVVSIEIVEEAVLSARDNAKLNGINNATFLCGDVFAVLDGLDFVPDTIIVDPPRDGLSPKAIEKIISYGVKNIVYVSCKPSSLVRDLQIFEQGGYSVEKVKLQDMFSRTYHVETVVKLSLKSGLPKIDITMEVDMDSLYTEEEKATYKNIKEYVQNKYGVDVHTSYIAQVKRMCGLDMGVNYNKASDDGAKAQQCPSDKVEYIKDALSYFKLI